MKVVLFRIFAWGSLLLGIIGMILPVMPTTPFLLAALYFAAESPRVRNLIKNHPLLNKYVEGYQKKSKYSCIVRYGPIAMLWCSLGISFYFSTSPAVDWSLLAVGISGTLFFLMFKIRQA